MEALRMIWYSLVGQRLRRGHGDGVAVCTPIGSRFSMEQMMMQLSALSRTTSISYSFQPSSDSSISSSLVGEASRPRLQMVSNSSGCRQCRRPCRQREAGADHGGESPRSLHRPGFVHAVGNARARRAQADAVMASLNFRRSSALSMASGGADQLDLVLVEHAVAPQVQRAVQRGLAAHGGQDGVGRSLAMIFRPSAR